MNCTEAFSFTKRPLNYYWLAIIEHWLAIFCVLLWAFDLLLDGQIFSVFSLSTQHIKEHHYWAYLSCNLVHVNFKHLMINLLVYYLLFSFVNHKYTHNTFAIYTLTIAFLSSMVLQNLFTIGWYVGLSAALHGVTVMVAWEEWKQHQLTGALLGSGLVLKLGYECYKQGQTFNSQWLSIDVFWQSHSVGFAVGLCLLLCLTIYDFFKHKQNNFGA